MFQKFISKIKGSYNNIIWNHNKISNSFNVTEIHEQTILNIEINDKYNSLISKWIHNCKDREEKRQENKNEINRILNENSELYNDLKDIILQWTWIVVEIIWNEKLWYDIEYLEKFLIWFLYDIKCDSKNIENYEKIKWIMSKKIKNNVFYSYWYYEWEFDFICDPDLPDWLNNIILIISNIKNEKYNYKSFYFDNDINN